MIAIGFKRTFFVCAIVSHSICAAEPIGAHAMKLGHLLFLAGMNRDTFNTLVKREHATFLTYGIEGDTSHDRYTEVHALALVTFSRLRVLGLAPIMANETVKASMQDIGRIVSGETEGLISDRCGVRYNSLGMLDHYGWPTKGTVGTRLIGAAYVDLRETWADVQDAMKDLV